MLSHVLQGGSSKVRRSIIQRDWNRVGMTLISVNHWIHRYSQEGISGLKTRSGRGRKLVMDIQDEDRTWFARQSRMTDKASTKFAKPGRKLSAKKLANQHSSDIYPSWRKVYANKKTLKGNTLAATLQIQKGEVART